MYILSFRHWGTLNFGSYVSDKLPTTCYSNWILLGRTLANPLRGITTSTHDVSITDGPDGMKAWQFKGNQNSYVKLRGNNLDLRSQSFTMAAFIYQDYLRDGTLMEFRDQGYKKYGTHITIHRKKLYIDLGAVWRNYKGYWNTPVEKKWHFVGASLNAKTEILLLWMDNRWTTQNVGNGGIRKMSGDLYFGVRLGDNTSPFKGKIAGATLMNCPVEWDQLSALKTDIIRRANGSKYNHTQLKWFWEY